MDGPPLFMRGDCVTMEVMTMEPERLRKLVRRDLVVVASAP